MIKALHTKHRYSHTTKDIRVDVTSEAIALTQCRDEIFSNVFMTRFSKPQHIQKLLTTCNNFWSYNHSGVGTCNTSQNGNIAIQQVSIVS